jgi:hypothetical protein
MAFEFVWRSDKDSVKNGTVSIAACIEVAFAYSAWSACWGGAGGADVNGKIKS